MCTLGRTILGYATHCYWGTPSQRLKHFHQWLLCGFGLYMDDGIVEEVFDPVFEQNEDRASQAGDEEIQTNK